MSHKEFNCEFKVEGMHCAACEMTIERNVQPLPGIEKVSATLSIQTLRLQIADGTDIALIKDQINAVIGEYGYKVVDALTKQKVNWNHMGIALLFSSLIVALFILLQNLGIAELVSGDQINLPIIFMIGIVASLSTCMAVVGGLVLTISSSYAKLEQDKVKPLVVFHLSRLVGFFILGGVIGLLGAAFTLSTLAIFIINVILFGVMIILGLNMLDAFPALKKFQFHLPKRLTAGGLNQENVRGFLAPITLGAITFFLPCGFTQSMQVYSLTTGSFLDGALTMFVFALGTFPVLALISFASTKFSRGLNSGLFFKTAGFLILFFAVFNFIGALVAAGLIRPVFNF